MQFHFHANQSHFRKNGFALRLALKQRHKRTPKGRRQRGRVVRAPDLKSGGHGFKSRSDHLAEVVSRWTLVQLLGHACK